MDRVRTNLRNAIAAKNTNMATVSRHAGKNHAYIQQFMDGTPRRLPEDVREKICRFLDIDENMLKDSPHSENAMLETSGNGLASETPAAPDKEATIMTIVGVIRALIDEHGAEAVQRAFAKAIRPERAVAVPPERQRMS